MQVTQAVNLIARVRSKSKHTCNLWGCYVIYVNHRVTDVPGNWVCVKLGEGVKSIFFTGKLGGQGWGGVEVWCLGSRKRKR
jgi:hypothetical protein